MKIRIVFIFIIALITGCISTISVKTDPPGCTIYVDQKRIGTTPCSFEVANWTEFVSIKIEKPGYIAREEVILRKMFDSSVGDLTTSGWPPKVFYVLLHKDEWAVRKYFHKYRQRPNPFKFP